MMIKILASTFAFAAMLGVVACGPEPANVCDHYRSVGQRAEIVARLENWVIGKIRDGKFSPPVRPSERIIHPGEYEVLLDDRKLIDALGPETEARILIDPDGTPAALFFGSQSFTGLLVEIPGRTAETVMRDGLVKVGAHTFLMCSGRSRATSD